MNLFSCWLSSISRSCLNSAIVPLASLLIWWNLIQKTLSCRVMRLVLKMNSFQILIWWIIIERLYSKISFLMLVVDRILWLILMVSAKMLLMLRCWVEHVDIWNDHIFFEMAFIIQMGVRHLSLICNVFRKWWVKNMPWIRWTTRIVLTRFIYEWPSFLLHDLRCSQHRATSMYRITGLI